METPLYQYAYGKPKEAPPAPQLTMDGGINADSAHECCRRAGWPQQVLDGSATSARAATDGNLHGVGQPFQHAGLLLHKDWAPGELGFTVQSVDAVSPEVETLIVRVDEVSSQDSGGLRETLRRPEYPDRNGLRLRPGQRVPTEFLRPRVKHRLPA